MYNVEQYIRKCILSCVNQNIPASEYEIIIINDGSPDNSLSIATELCKTLSNVTIFSQENKGLSAARNIGMQMAKGDYIMFVDSDDWIDENCLKDVLADACGNDILCLGYIMEFENGGLPHTQMPPSVKTNTGAALLKTREFCIPAQFYIYKLQFLLDNNLSFYEGIYHEDMEFTPRMLTLANTIAIYTTPVYHYLIRAKSITTSVNSKRSFDLIKVATSLDKFSSTFKDNGLRKVFSYYISMALNTAMHLSKYYSTEEIQKLTDILYKNRSLFKHLIKSPMAKNKIEGVLFNMMPRKCLKIYNVLISCK